MARQSRVLSETGMYHIMFRGINKQDIFSSERDYQKLKDIIQSAKENCNVQIYAYCMMPNHVHLFLREEEAGDVSDFMKRILSHYAGWYNFKYERTGHLFANRYKSIPVEDDSYFLILAKYIHQNPVKAGIVSDLSQYPHSSYLDYIHNIDGFVDIDYLLSMYDEERSVAIKQFINFNMSSDDVDYDIENSVKMKEVAAKIKIMQLTGGMMPYEIRKLPKQERYKLLKTLIEEHNIQKIVLERVTGISRRTMLNL